MHAADPCGHSHRVRANSNVTHAAGKATHALHSARRRASARISNTAPANTAAAVPKLISNTAAGAPNARRYPHRLRPPAIHADHATTPACHAGLRSAK